MAFPTIFDFSLAPGSNTEIDGISLAENVMLPSAVNNAFRELMSQLAGYNKDLVGLGQTIGGSANAITVTVNQPWTALADGQLIVFKNTSGPNTAATTLTITPGGGGGAFATKDLVVNGGAAMAGGELLDNAYVMVRYDSTLDDYVHMNGGGTVAFATNAQAVTGTSTALAVNPANLLATRQLLSGVPFNLGLAAAVGSSALTISLKGADGNDPSATNPVEVPFRNVTAATGTPTVISVTAATSLVVSSGSTLGMTSGVAATLAIVAFNDAGTFRLGIINPLVRPLNDGIASSTAEGGAGAADSAGVIYTGSAVTSKAMTVLGYATVTEATAGTWATAPATLKVAGAPEVNNVVPIITPWVAYTPTFTGFGTPSAVFFESRRVGDTLEVRGKFTSGTSTATEARITLGFNGVDGAVVSDAVKVPTIQLAGIGVISAAAAYVITLLIESNIGYFTVGLQGSAAAGLTKRDGSGLLSSGQSLGFTAAVPISGW